MPGVVSIAAAGSRYYPTGFSYPTTQYVAPYASVSGATSDQQDLGATAWTNAANSGTPTTLGTAMARATAGSYVQCAPGVYIGTLVNSRWSAPFKPANSGSSGNPIVFFAQYPGAYNEGSTSLYSELRADTTAIRAAVAGITGGQDYIIFDGFVFDQTYSYPRPSNGNFCIGSTTGANNCEIRRFLCLNQEQPSGDNYSNFFVEAATNFRLTDTRGRGGNTGGEGDLITMYGCVNFMLEHNECIDMRIGMYAKGSNGSTYNSGTMRYNYGEGITDKWLMASVVEPTLGIDIYQNLAVECIQAWRADPAGEGPNHCRLYNNTFVNSVASTDRHEALIWFEGTVPPSGNEWYNNIVANTSASSTVNLGCIQMTTAITTAFSILDYNNYYNAGSSLYFSDNQDNDTSGSWMNFASWQSFVSDEANSITSNPSFVNSAAGNFRLNTGSPALTAGDNGGPVGCYITGNEEIGLRANPTY